MKQEQSPQVHPNMEEPNLDLHSPRKRLENLQSMLPNSMNQLRALANSRDNKKLVAKINRFELELSTALECVLERSEIKQTQYEELQYSFDGFYDEVLQIITKFEILETIIYSLAQYITEERTLDSQVD